jgi:hypothetical protein
VDDTPARFFVIRGEESIMHSLANLYAWSHHGLSKPLLIADFFKQRCTCNEDDLLSEDVDFEDWS